MSNIDQQQLQQGGDAANLADAQNGGAGGALNATGEATHAEDLEKLFKAWEPTKTPFNFKGVDVDVRSMTFAEDVEMGLLKDNSEKSWFRIQRCVLVKGTDKPFFSKKHYDLWKKSKVDADWFALNALISLGAESENIVSDEAVALGNSNRT